MKSHKFPKLQTTFNDAGYLTELEDKALLLKTLLIQVILWGKQTGTYLEFHSYLLSLKSAGRSYASFRGTK